MTRKDYELLAGVIRRQLNCYTEEIGESAEILAVSCVAQALAVALLRDNPRFDRDRFLKATGL